MNLIRKNAPPATAAALQARAAELRATIESDAGTREQLESDMPQAVADAAAFGSLREEIDRLDASLRSDRKALALIEAQIPAAEQREATERMADEREEQRRQSAKVRRDLAARYSKAAEALAAVLTEVEADNRAWEILNMRAREFGFPNGESAERQVRKETGKRPNGAWYSLTEGIVVRDWTGRVLFGGTVGTYF